MDYIAKVNSYSQSDLPRIRHYSVGVVKGFLNFYGAFAGLQGVIKLDQKGISNSFDFSRQELSNVLSNSLVVRFQGFEGTGLIQLGQRSVAHQIRERNC